MEKSFSWKLLLYIFLYYYYHIYYILLYIIIYIYIYIYIYLLRSPSVMLICACYILLNIYYYICIKKKFKTHSFSTNTLLSLRNCLQSIYRDEIFYKKDIFKKSKMCKIKCERQIQKHCIYCQLENKLLMKVTNWVIAKNKSHKVFKRYQWRSYLQQVPCKYRTCLPHFHTKTMQKQHSVHIISTRNTSRGFLELS